MLLTLLLGWHCHAIKGTIVQSFFPIVSKEASQYDSQFQHWDSEFRPHEIGQIPLVGNHFPYNNVFYDTNSGAISEENELDKETNDSDNNVNNSVHQSPQEKSDKQNALSVDDRSVSYEGWSVLTKEDKNRINVNSKNTFGNDDVHASLNAPITTNPPPIIQMPKRQFSNKYNHRTRNQMTHLPPKQRFPRKKSYKHYRQGQDVINESFNEISQAPVSFSNSPWKRKYSRNQFNRGGFRKHRRKMNPFEGRNKRKRFQRKKKAHFRRHPKGHERRRHQPYKPHPLSRQLNYNPIGVSVGVTSPIHGNHLEHAPIYMNNAVKQTNGFFGRVKNGFKGIARGWRFTVDETARVFKDALDKTVRRVSHGYSKMGRKRNDRLREYNVGYRYPEKAELDHPSMDYHMNFHPIANPYPDYMDEEIGRNQMTSSKYDYDLYGNFIENEDYSDYGKERTVASHGQTKQHNTLSNNKYKWPNTQTTTPDSIVSNMETPFHSNMHDQTSFLQSPPGFGSSVGNSSPIKHPTRATPRRPSTAASTTSASRENSENMENSTKTDLENKKRQKLKDIWRKNPRRKRQPLKMNITKIVTTKRPRKTAFGYLRNTARPGKRENKNNKSLKKNMGMTKREEDLKEVTQAWYSYYRKLKSYRQKYRRNSDISFSESMAAAKRFSRNKNKYPPYKNVMMPQHKPEMKRISPPTTVRSTAVLQSPFEHHTNWQASSRTHPTIPNSIQDVIHGNQYHNPPKVATTVQMMTKEIKKENMIPETPQMQEPGYDSHQHQEIAAANAESQDGYSVSPTQHWIDKTNSLNDVGSNYQMADKENISNDIEYEYVYEDDTSPIVYGEILTPDWQNAYNRPVSNHQQTSSSNEISAQAIAKELSAMEARMIASHEISTDLVNSKEMVSEEGLSPEIDVTDEKVGP